MPTVGKPITCKAAVVWEPQKPIKIETVEVLPPGKGEVRVKIVAAGLCHSDLSQWKGSLPSPVPFVMGHEGGGIVESVGEGVTTVKPGDKVLTLFLPHCKKCKPCLDKRTNVCEDPERKEVRPIAIQRTLGMDGTHRFTCNGKPLFSINGASCFAEYTVIPENSCVKVNPNTPLEKACIMACGFSTGYGSSTNAVEIKPGDAVAVWGMGGVGLAAVVGCKIKGAGKIIGIDVSPEKEALARKMGCTDYISLSKVTGPLHETIIKETNGGLNFAFVCIGNTQAMETALLSTANGGSAVIVGVAPVTANMNVNPFHLLFSRKLIGTFIGDYKIRDDLPKVVDEYLAGKFSLDDFITGKFKLEQINETVDLMLAGKSIRSVILF